MNKEKLKIGKAITYACALLASWIGAGFATGQEILQYFAAWDYQLFIVAIVAALVAGWAFYSYGCAGAKQNFSSNTEIFQYYAGKTIGKIFGVFCVGLCFCIYIYMVAGAGSTINEQFGLPVWVGVIGIGVLIMLAATLKLTKITEILGHLGAVVVFMLFFVVLVNLLKNIGAVPENFRLLAEDYSQFGIHKATSPNAVITGFVYIGGSLAYTCVFISQMVHKSERKREAKAGVLLGCVMIGVILVTYALTMVANVQLVGPTSVPTLILAQQIAKPVGVIYAVIVLCAIFECSTPLLWTVSSSLFPEGSGKAKLVVLVCGIAGILIALFVPYKILLDAIVSAGGYAMMVFFVFIVVHDVRDFISRKN